MKQELRLNRKELCNYLNVTNQALKGIIRRKQLEDRIHMANKHYILSDIIETSGKNTIYVLKYIKCETFKDWQSRFKIKNKEIHKRYVIDRIKNPRLSRSELIIACGNKITYYIASKYDKILEEEGFIEKDGYEYRLWRSSGDIVVITEKEFRTFWNKNSKANGIRLHYVKLLNNKDISEDEFFKFVKELSEKYPEMTEFAYKFTAYKNVKNVKKLLNWIGSD